MAIDNPDRTRQLILDHVRSDRYRPLRPRQLARDLDLHGEDVYGGFKEALRELLENNLLTYARRGTITTSLAADKQIPLPETNAPLNETNKDNNSTGKNLSGDKNSSGGNSTENIPVRDVFIGVYKATRRGFGFVTAPAGDHEYDYDELFIAENANDAGANSGDSVKCRITRRSERDGKPQAEGRIVEIVERKHTKFAGVLIKDKNTWTVLPDGNVFKLPINTPDAAGLYLAPGTKVIVEVTQFPRDIDEPATGVIVEALGRPGDSDVELKSVIVGHGLPGEFPEEVKNQASSAVQRFDPETERARRLDLTGEIVATIDPDDAKDYDDAISLRQLDDGMVELAVHIADVSFFVPAGSALDEEARARGNSTYFPGHVIPMLPEVLSNGVCSLQEGVPRLVKTALITLDKDARPVKTRFANAIIKSRKRLRYREAQAIIDGAEKIPHPDGDKTIGDYEPEVVELVRQMNTLARRMQKRRQQDGQLVLDLPAIQLVLDDRGQVIDAVPEDDSFTHTLIEMFMVEANEAVARLFQKLDLPALRRTHPEPDPDAGKRLSKFVMVAGHKIPTEPSRQDLQKLLSGAKGKPEAFAINMAVLRSLARAVYSPDEIGHFALASKHYAHFTSPIRRYADLTIHRLLDACFAAVNSPAAGFNELARALGTSLKSSVPSFEALTTLGKQLSFTERRSEAAERELRQVKTLHLLEKHIGEEYPGVVTGIVGFGLFIQIQPWQIEGLVKFPELLDEWWEVDVQGGVIRGRRTGRRIHVGDIARVQITAVDLARRELNIRVLDITSRGMSGAPLQKGQHQQNASGKPRDSNNATGKDKRASRSKSRDKRKTQHRRKES